MWLAALKENLHLKY
jgi:hypothetical protein